MAEKRPTPFPSSGLFPLKTSWPETSRTKIYFPSGYWSRCFHLTLMMSSRALLFGTLHLCMQEAVGERAWFGALKYIVFSFRQTWVQMPTPLCTSLWGRPIYVTSLAFSLFIFKTETVIRVSKLARLKWDMINGNALFKCWFSFWELRQTQSFLWDHRSQLQAPDTNLFVSYHSLGATSLPECSTGRPDWNTHSLVSITRTICSKNVWHLNTSRASLHRLKTDLCLNTDTQE